nr:MAG TPA: hypothetical protein [Caudoviricetes sp.]
MNLNIKVSCHTLETRQKLHDTQPSLMDSYPNYI